MTVRTMHSEYLAISLHCMFAWQQIKAAFSCLPELAPPERAATVAHCSIRLYLVIIVQTN